MPVEAMATTAAIILFGSAVQGAVGFGMGMVAVPLLIRTGYDLPAAVATLLGASLVQSLLGAWQYRADILWRPVWAVTVTRWIGIPLGIAAMVALLDHDPAVVRASIGALLLVLITGRVAWRPTAREHVAPGWLAASGVTSGFLASLVGMGAPPLLLFAMAHDWSKDQFRSFLWCVFVLGTPVAMIALAFRLGHHLWWDYALGTAAVPVVWLGSRIGLAVSANWETRHVHRVATVLLYVIALSSFEALL